MNRTMTWYRSLVLPLVAVFSLSAAVAADDAAQLGPYELVQKVAQDTLKDLDAHRAEYQKNPRRVRELVDKNMLPYFDTAYAAQLVLAKHWRTATPEQRQRFIKAFYDSLLKNYGTALLDFTSDRLTVLPFRGDAKDDRATVRTQVKRNDGTRVDVNYVMRKTAEGWKAWDVSIEGISYVKNFKDDFGAEIEQKGLESVIKRMEAEGVKPQKKG